MKTRNKIKYLLAAAFLAACSAISRLYPVPAGAADKPLVIVACGWAEDPGHSVTDTLCNDLRARGYEVRQYAYDKVPAWDDDRPVIAIGFSYGGDALCDLSRKGCRIDLLVLLNPVRQGSILDQGGTLRVGSVGRLRAFASNDNLPKASRRFYSPGGEWYAAEIVPDTNHTGLVAAVKNKVEDLVLTFP